MKFYRRRLSYHLLPGLALLLVAGSLFAQVSPKPLDLDRALEEEKSDPSSDGERVLRLPQDSGPINLDRALQSDEAREPDQALSYYHYALAKWYESNGDTVRAISEMQLALETNPNSSALHYELAMFQARIGNIAEATRYAEKSTALDAQNPDPHWLLANIYISSQARQRERGAAMAILRKAVAEFEILEKLTPDDERIYYALGSVYFDLGEPDKAVAAFEKYQKYSGSDTGYREIAKYYEGAGKIDLAIEYLNRGLEVQPNSTESLMMLGNIYLKLGKNKEAVPIFRKLMSLSSGSVPVMRRLAATLFESGEYAEAAGVLEELAAKARPDRTSQVLLGRCYLALNRTDDAIKLFNEIISRVPDDMEARFYLARTYEDSGDYQAAIKIYEALLDDTNTPGIAENQLTFQARLAEIWTELGDYPQAIAMYEKMVAADPKINPQLLNIYRVSQQYDKALALGKKLIAEYPDDVYLGIVYGRTLADAGEEKKAVEFLTGLLQKNSDNIDLYINLSEVYRQDKHYSDAEKILLRAEQQSQQPEAVERLKFQRATIYEQQKHYDRAEQLFREILKTSPDNATVLNYLGYMFADRGTNLDEAVSLLEKALQLDPDNGAYLDSLGWAYFKRNDMVNAEKYLLQAVRFVHNDPTIHDHLGDLYLKTGQLDKARDAWAKASSIERDKEVARKIQRKLTRVQEQLRRKNSSQ